MKTVIEIREAASPEDTYLLFVNDKYILTDDCSLVLSYARRLHDTIPDSLLLGYPEELL
jgi:hypothetical protein